MRDTKQIVAAFGWTTLLAILCLAVACRPTSVPPTPRPTPTPTYAQPNLRTVKVDVHDAQTGEPVAGANVQVGEHEGKTDQHGTYALNVSHGELYPVEASVLGYQDWQGELDATTAGNSILDFDVTLTPKSTQVTVVGPNGKALARAAIELNGQQFEADSKGQLTIYRVKAGDQLSATHPGYEGSHVTLDEDLSPLQLSLEPISVSLSVRDAISGLAVPGVSLCAQTKVCQETDDLGETVLEPVALGAAITAERDGYHPNQNTHQGQGHLEIELVPREFHATIRDKTTGEPLTKTVVLANDEMLSRTSDGSYSLPDPTTPYTLFVKSPGYSRISIPVSQEIQIGQHDALDVCQQPESEPCLDISLSPFAVRGIYAYFGLLNWNRERMLELIDLVDRSPMLNAIVVDIKGDYGYIAFQSENPLIAEVDAMSDPRLPLSEFLELCREKEIYTIARMVIFKDNPLVEARPELAVRHPNGEIFYDREGLAWADPTREEVWDYNIAITLEAIELGFDEIQYDYLRYPSDSTSLAVVRALVYSIPSTLESRTAAIRGFVAAAKEAVDPTPAFLSADLFGYSLVVDPEHDMRIGQRLMDLAPHVDYVCPMIYPSTFIPGNLGLSSPSDEPYEVIARSMALGTARTDTILRPWLQGYWYERQDFEDQLRAVQESAAERGVDAGWCFWNAGAEYDVGLFVPGESTEP
jgi:hypothetical protein